LIDDKLATNLYIYYQFQFLGHFTIPEWIKRGQGKRRNHQQFVRNALASAVANRAADHHQSGLGFKSCPFAGQPLHVMNSILYRQLLGLLKIRNNTTTPSAPDSLAKNVTGFGLSSKEVPPATDLVAIRSIPM